MAQKIYKSILYHCTNAQLCIGQTECGDAPDAGGSGTKYVEAGFGRFLFQRYKWALEIGSRAFS